MTKEEFLVLVGENSDIDPLYLEEQFEQMIESERRKAVEEFVYKIKEKRVFVGVGDSHIETDDIEEVFTSLYPEK